MSTTDGTPGLVMDQAPRSTATPPVDDVTARFMATYRASFDDGDFFRCVRNGLILAIPFWLIVGLIWWLTR